VTATGGTTPYTWSVVNQPNGMGINSSSGALFGTPTAAGTFNLTVTVQDSGNPQQTASKVLSLTVNGATSTLSITTTALNPPTATVGTGYGAFQAVAATGGTTPYTWSVVNQPNGMGINSSSGALFGTPTAAGTFNLTVTVQDSSNPQQTASKVLSLTVAGATSTLSITTTALNPPTATVGTGYGAFQAVAATGGTTPYTWSVVNQPNGMGINSSSGALFGTPTAAGTFNLTVTVRDSGNPQQTASKTLLLTVNGATSTLSITTTALNPPTATVGTGYGAFQAVTATGGTTPYTWSVVNQPNGMGINSSSGALFGTPTTAGTFNLTVTVRDSGNPQQTASKVLSLAVAGATSTLSITTASLSPPTATVGTGYAAQQAISATGGITPYSWSVSGQPNGMEINSSTGALFGTPTAAGTFSLTVTVHDNGNPQQTASKAFLLTVAGAISTLSITTTALNPPTGTVGTGYAAQQAVAATGGVTPYTWSVSNQPNGIEINSSTGALFGTPTVAGTFNLTFTVHDNGNPQQTASKALPFTVAGSTTTLSITTTAFSPPTATVGTGYVAQQAVSATGGTTPYSWSVAGQPNGMDINSSSGALFGTPTVPGTFNVTVMVHDSGNPQQTAAKALTLTVAGATSTLSITTTSLSPPTATVGTAYAAQQAMAAIGGTTPYTWSASGLPNGMTINSTFGSVFGTPTVAGLFNFTVTVRDSGNPQQTASRALSITVANGGGGITITSITPPSPVATSQSQNINVIGAGFQPNLTVDLLSNGTPVGHLTGSQIQQVTPQSFVLNINFNGNAGAYALRVNSPNGDTSSASFFFNAVAPIKPQLTISRSSVSFQSIAGQNAPTPQNVIVSTAGAVGALSFGVSISYGGTAKWLAASPITGTTPANLNLAVASGLPIGNYTATVTISSTTDSTQVARIEAALVVVPANLTMGEITMVDPVPSLLFGPGVTRVWDTLFSGGTRVKGVAADGVAQVVLKIPSIRVGEVFALRVYNACTDIGVPSASSDYDGGLLQPGGSIENPPSSLDVISVQVSGHYMAFAVYRAPLDFVRPSQFTPLGANDATASIRCAGISVQSADGPVGSQKIDIKRTPVLLVHGLWSEPSTWDFFCPVTPELSLIKCSQGPLTSLFKTYRADYKVTNGLSFKTNATTVFVDERQFLRDFKVKEEVAAIQWDVIAHSMGGNVARMIPWFTAYRRDANFNAGDFHKLITIDTPHLGSEFAALLDRSNISCKVGFELSGNIVGGAIRDLVPGSAALNPIPAQIVLPLRSHAVVGRASDLQDSMTASGIGTLLRLLCPSLFPSGTFRAVFDNQDSDLIVSVDSQRAGSLIPFTLFPGIVHAVDAKLFKWGPDNLGRDVLSTLSVVVGADSAAPGKVVELLNTWISNRSAFGLLPALGCTEDRPC
jgi:P2-related tail formation protein/pimeloyl-ACP methyl ester carboxylesterase